MKNTLKNKQKFFAQYLNQKVFNDGNGEYLYPLKGRFLESVTNQEYLVLKPFSSITDEDAIDVAKSICSYFTFNDKNVVSKDRNGNTNVINGNYTLKIGQKVDELNKGFVLIVNGVAQRMFASEAIMFYRKLIELGYYVVEESEIEYGWVKLIGQ